MNLRAEKDLINKARKDPKAYGKLYDLYANRIFNYAFKRVADFDLANDITSEVFLKGYLNLWKFKWKNISISSWFYRIANNEINSYFRKKKYNPDSLNEILGRRKMEIYDQQTYLDEKNEAEQKMKDFNDFREVQKALKLLPVKYQEVIALKYFEQKKVTEIATILNKKEGTVKSLLSRGLEKIRKILI